MKRNQSEYILNIKTQIDESERALKTLSSQLDDLWGKGKAPKSFTNSIDDLANKLLSLKEITKHDGMVDSSSLKQAESDSKKLAKEILSLKINLQQLSEEQKKALVTGDTKEKMEARAKAVKSYNEAIAQQKKLIKEKAELEDKISKTKDKKTSIVQPVLESAGKKVQTLQELQARKATIATNRKNALDKGKSKTGVEVTRLKELEEAVQKEIDALQIEEETLAKGKQELKEYAEASKKAADDSDAFQKDIDELSNKLRKVDRALDVNAFEELKKELQDLGVSGIESAKNFADIEKILKKLDKEAIAPVDNAIEEMISSLDKLEKEQKDVAGEINKTSEALKEQNEAAKLKEAFEGRIKQFLGLAGAAQVMRRALNDAFHTISELDAVMGQMAVVTDLSVGDYWDQLPEYAERAKELGVSITEAYEAATLYYQQGLKTNEVVALSEQTMKMATIAGISTADATDKMTAALRGFNMELNETSAQRIADVYSELAAITAADVNEISNAMTKTASIASSAGMEFETTAAFLSQIIETTRESAETAGTALKTVIARFQELKKSPDEIGEIDGEIVDANAIETALRSVGVALRDSSGQFRELDDVFLELSSKWNTLDKNTQRYIATIAAGSRQQSRFIAMMQDYSRTQELVAAANSSAGASQEQFEKTTETLGYKLNELKTTWKEFTMGIMNSQLVKTGVDILTKFLEIINKATSAFNGLGGSITKIISVVAIFNLGKVIYEKLSGPIESLFLGELPKMAYKSGKSAMQQFLKGSQEVVNEQNNSNEEHNNQDQKASNTKESLTNRTVGKLKSGRKNLVAARETKTYAKELKQKADSMQSKAEESNFSLGMAEIELSDIQQKKKRIQETYNTRKNTRAKSGEGKKKQAELKSLENELKAVNAAEKEAQDTVDSLKQDVKDYEQVRKEQLEVEKQFNEQSKQGWSDIANGIGAAGEAVAGVGVGISMIGGLMSSLGLEEFGDALQNIGGIITMIGGALMAIPPILTLISSHPIIAIIVLFLGAVLAGITAIAKAIKDASPEGKLKKAQETAEKASEAADQVAESYENLKDSLERLSDQQETLEKLTQGTKEWNNAIMEINNSVLDLIEKYPELAQFVKTDDGVLRLDIDSAEVQNVLKKAKTSAILSKNISTLASAAMAQAETAVKKKDYNLDGEVEEISKQVARGQLIIANGTITAGTEDLEGLGYTQEQLDDFYEANQDIIDSLRDYGRDLLTAEANVSAAYSAMAISVQQMANTASSFTSKQAAVVSNLVNEEIISQVYKESLDTISDIDYTDKSLASKAKKERDDAIKEVYGPDAKAEDYTNEQIQAAIAQTRTMERATGLAEMIPIALNNLRENNSSDVANMLINLLADQDGGQLTTKDYNKLALLNEEDLKKIYVDLGKVGEDIYGSEKKFLDSINKTKAIINEQNKQAKKSSANIFGESYQLPDWNISSQLNNELWSKFSLIFDRAGLETFQGLYDSFDTLMMKLSEEQQVLLASIIEGTDLGDTSQLAALPQKLEEAGLGYEVLGEEVYNFINQAKEATHAIAKLGSEELGQVLKNIEDVINNIDKNEQGRFFKEEQYKSLLTADPTLQKEFVKVADSYMYLGNNMDNLKTAILDNTKALMGKQDITKEDNKVAVDLIDKTNTYMNTLVEKGEEYSKAYNDWYNAENSKVDYQKEYDAAVAAIVNADLGTSLALEGVQADTDTFLGALADFALPFTGDLVGGFTGGGVTEAYELLNNLNKAETKLNNISNYKLALDAQSNNEQYKNYSKDIESMTKDQLVNYFENLSSQLSQAGLDVSIFDIAGLINGQDFSNTGEITLRNWYTQIQNILSNSEDFINREKTTENNTDVGNMIYTLAISGSAGLRDWYNTDYTESDTNKAILKGAMIKLASKYDISDSISSNYLDDKGNFITTKFDDFIKLIGEYEKEEQNRPEKDKTIDLINQVKDALIESRQKEIDTLAEKFDAIAEANNKMVNSLQELVNIDRQRRENEKTKQDISDKYNQLAYLGMDSSGGNALEKLALQEEIKQAEQDYQDTLVDQAIQQLQDANQKAEEQRERQISLMQAQLDLWANSEQIWGEVNAIIVNAQPALEDNALYDGTELAKLLSNAGGNLTNEEKEDLARDIVRLLQGYTDYHANTQYATGGLADFTGPAWLDGTPSKPEYVLNAKQTERFFSLVDVLEGIDTNRGEQKPAGDNYFDININVEKLEDDYDVEQMADKIRRMIYDDATYRNVNTINHMR